MRSATDEMDEDNEAEDNDPGSSTPVAPPRSTELYGARRPLELFKSVSKPGMSYVGLSRAKKDEVFALEESPETGLLAKIGNGPSAQKRRTDNAMFKVRETTESDFEREDG
jgi:hypothetical protein